jgi:hypothetical protein
MAYLMAKPDEDTWTQYRSQVQGQMLIGGFEVVHFYSYHPRMPAKYVATSPDSKFISVLAQAVADFIGELDEDTKRARELGTFVPVEEIFAGLASGYGGT